MGFFSNFLRKMNPNRSKYIISFTYNYTYESFEVYAYSRSNAINIAKDLLAKKYGSNARFTRPSRVECCSSGRVDQYRW